MTEVNENVPNWLDKLEKRRELRVQRKLGHETGAGSSCLNCLDKCAGLDLHFWRKICKNCKCPKDAHDIVDDYDPCSIQFEFLGQKSKPKGTISLKNHKDVTLDWLPKGDDNKAITRYLQEMPEEQLPVTGSKASKLRIQALQKQIPAHDIDPKSCDGLSEKEVVKLVEYVGHVKNCAGQGSVVELPVHRGATHILQEANAKFERMKIGVQMGQSVDAERLVPEISEKLPKKCHECEKAMQPGTLAVTAKSKTSNLWHADCFKCNHCKQPLVDLLYFFHKPSDHVYCLRDYAHVIGMPRCHACDELIFSGAFTVAEEKTFHVKHFCCYECDTPLAGLEYVMAGIGSGHDSAEQPICLACYEKRASFCRDCARKIGPDEQGAMLQGLHWHVPRCFVCRHCRKNLIGGKVLMNDEHIYCSAPCVAMRTT